MKILLIFIAGAAILAAGVFIGSVSQKEKVSLPTEQSAAVGKAYKTAPTRTNLSDSNGQAIPEQLSSGNLTGKPPLVSPLEKGERVQVVRVIDGDTIDVLIDGKIERVRYIGIDTPETVDPVRGKSLGATAVRHGGRTSNGVNPRKTVQCFGVEASKKNKELVEGKTVRLEKDITERDKYNRLLRYIWLGDTFVTLALVEQGFATSFSYPPDIKYQDRIVAAEKTARENKLGLWTACASETASITI